MSSQPLNKLFSDDSRFTKIYQIWHTCGIPVIIIIETFYIKIYKLFSLCRFWVTGHGKYLYYKQGVFFGGKSRKPFSQDNPHVTIIYISLPVIGSYRKYKFDL